MYYANPVKHELARVESARTGESIHDIYVRMGGLVVGEEANGPTGVVTLEPEVAKVPKARKTKKK